MVGSSQKPCQNQHLKETLQSCSSGELGGRNTRWMPSGTATSPLLCQPARVQRQEDTTLWASAYCLRPRAAKHY